jgi:hypothetical protein
MFELLTSSLLNIAVAIPFHIDTKPLYELSKATQPPENLPTNFNRP